VALLFGVVHVGEGIVCSLLCYGTAMVESLERLVAVVGNYLVCKLYLVMCLVFALGWKPHSGQWAHWIRLLM
jgi:hypothetical protein